MLESLQPNIVKAHVRDKIILLFLRFTDAAGAKSFIAGLAGQMKSALQHLAEVQAFKQTRVPGTPYLGFGLTAAGYGALGITSVPADAAFAQKMSGNSGLNDPATGDQEAPFNEPGGLHAVILIGDATAASADALHQSVTATIGKATGVTVLQTQVGLGQHNANGDGIEHFGYVDGRSQPLFLEEDVADETATTDGTDSWSPDFPLGQVIVSDPAAPDPSVHFGSYFIYRKLEQNVKLFKAQEAELAEKLKLADEERAGAMIVGRFEDGTPVTMQFAEGTHNPVPNNFSYLSDGEGAKCPFAGHIRKTNPRGNSDFVRSVIMARRGQTYGKRDDDPNDGEIDNKPDKDVGLLFMAFNSDIQAQFEFTQISWANNASFPTAGVGVDPVIGQTKNDAARPDITCPVVWGDPGSMATVANVPRAVKMKGGEYFFMPSLAFLKSLEGG
jgi:Dyp-type peroxidase family